MLSACELVLGPYPFCLSDELAIPERRASVAYGSREGTACPFRGSFGRTLSSASEARCPNASSTESLTSQRSTDPLTCKLVREDRHDCRGRTRKQRIYTPEGPKDPPWRTTHTHHPTKVIPSADRPPSATRYCRIRHSNYIKAPFFIAPSERHRNRLSSIHIHIHIQ